MQRVVFLDRDGTLNVDAGYIHRIEQWRFVEGAVEALQVLSDCGFALALVTNQSGIGRRMYTLPDVEQLHDFVQMELRRHGVAINAIGICPHLPADNCGCRKPKTGLYSQIAAAIDQPIDLSRCWTIGDKPIDVQFGQALGTRTVLLRSNYWSSTAKKAEADFIAENLLDAALKIKGLTVV